MKKTFKTLFLFMLVCAMAVSLFGTMAAATAEDGGTLDLDKKGSTEMIIGGSDDSDKSGSDASGSDSSDDSGKTPNAPVLDIDVDGKEHVKVRIPKSVSALISNGVEFELDKGYYIASITSGGESLMRCVDAELDDNSVVLKFTDVAPSKDDDDDDDEDKDYAVYYVGGMSIEVEIGKLSDGGAYQGSRGMTPYGTHNFVNVPEVVSFGSDKYTVAISHFDTDDIVDGGDGFYYYSFIVLANGEIVDLYGDDSFVPPIPFSVRHIYIANACVNLDNLGPFTAMNPIPNHFSIMSAGGSFTIDFDYDVMTGIPSGYVVVDAYGDKLDEDEFWAEPTGTIRVDPQDTINVKIKSLTAEYTGGPITITEKPEISWDYDLGITGIVYDYEKGGTHYSAPTEIGTYNVTMTTYCFYDTTNEQPIPASKYFKTVNVTNGTLTITARKITVKPIDATYTYDGKSHTAGFVVSDGSFLSSTDRDSLTVKFDTEVFEATATPLDCKITSATVSANPSLYNVVFDASAVGKLTINKKPITFQVGNYNATYTGSSITAPATVTVNNIGTFADTDHLDPSYTIAGSGTLAGTYPISVSGIKIMHSNGTDVTGSYDIKYNNGTLSILNNSSLPRVTIYLHGSEKTYDGQNLIIGCTNDLDAEAQKTVSKIIVTGTDLGSKPFDKKMITGADVTVALYDKSNTLLPNTNYSLEVVSTWAAINKVNLNITPASVTKNYDGNPYDGTIEKSTTFNGQPVTIKATAYAYSGSTKVNGCAVGSYTLKVDPSTVQVLDKGGSSIVPLPISDYFNINCTDSTLTVKATIGSGTYSKSAGGTVTITCSLPKKNLKEVIVGDMKLVEGTHYTINPNSNGTAVIFKDAEFLKSLTNGTYPVIFVYDNAGGVGPDVEMKTTLRVNATGATSSTSTPQTGDTANPVLWVVILAVCFVAIVLVVVFLLRKNKKA